MRKILLTTTESLQGWEIESYLQPIFSNVVVGAGFLSEIGASFSDLFGSRSSSYEKTLKVVNDSALQILQSKASELGANCVIGIKVNTHQISGKNTQMFMISAYGTAVLAKNTTAVKTTTSLKEIDKSTVVERATLINLLNNFKKEGFRPTLSDLQFIVESKSGEFKSDVFSILRKLVKQSSGDETVQDGERYCLEYFSVIDPSDAITILYESLFVETDEILINKIVSVIKTYDLVDYDRCVQLLNSQSQLKKKVALHILTSNKHTYVIDDILPIKKIALILEASFPILSNVTTQKGFLSSSPKEVWVCTCSKSNPISEVYCGYCYNNQYGFRAEELKPSTVIDNLNNKALALEELFKSANQ